MSNEDINALRREEYHSNPRIRQLQADRKARNKLVLAQAIREAKTPCASCGFFHPGSMDFHHINPEDKTWAIATAVSRGTSVQRLQEELAKCVCLCSNCHNILHWLERTTGSLPSAVFHLPTA